MDELGRTFRLYRVSLGRSRSGRTSILRATGYRVGKMDNLTRFVGNHPL